MIENIQYRNTLPPGFESWTQLYFQCDLGRVVGHASCHMDTKTLLLNAETQSPLRRHRFGKLELDIDFLKARLFDEFMLQTSIDKNMASRFRAIAFTHPDQSAFEGQSFKTALGELVLLGRAVAQIKAGAAQHIWRIE